MIAQQTRVSDAVSGSCRGRARGADGGFRRRSPAGGLIAPGRRRCRGTNDETKGSDKGVRNLSYSSPFKGVRNLSCFSPSASLAGPDVCAAGRGGEASIPGPASAPFGTATDPGRREYPGSRTDARHPTPRPPPLGSSRPASPATKGAGVLFCVARALVDCPEWQSARPGRGLARSLVGFSRPASAPIFRWEWPEPSSLPFFFLFCASRLQPAARPSPGPCASQEY